MDKVTRVESIWNSVSYYFNELKMAIYGVFVYLNINTQTTVILMWLMLLDTVFGITKSIVLGKKISMQILLIGLLSKFLFILFPLVLALIGKGVNFDFTWAVTTVLSLMIVAEGISIFTSFLSIRTKKEIRQEDYITKILIAIRDMLKSVLNQLFDKIRNFKISEDEK